MAKEYLSKSLETQGAGGALGVNGIPNGSHVRDDEQVRDKNLETSGLVASDPVIFIIIYLMGTICKATFSIC